MCAPRASRVRGIGQPHADAVFGIDVEDVNRRPCNCGQADDEASALREMFRPLLASGIEKLGDPPRLGIVPGQVGALVQIAVDAGEREVCGGVTAAVLSRQDVLDLELDDGRLRLAQLAILAPVASPLPDVVPRPLIQL